MNKLSEKNIGILCGGWSEERLISLDSGKSAYNSLIDNNLNAFLFDFKDNDINMLSNFIESNKYRYCLEFNSWFWW